MGSRESEKVQRAKRRLQAITFLTNISLDGSYKDTGWGLEHAKLEAATHSAIVHSCRNNGNHKDHNQDSYFDGAYGSMSSCSPTCNDSERNFLLSIANSRGIGHIQGHFRGSSADGRIGNNQPESEVSNPNPVSHFDGFFSRKRANTTQGSDASLFMKGRRSNSSGNPHVTENYPPVIPNTQKHAHFSSNESFEQPGHSKQYKQINGSDSSVTFGREVKVFNLREQRPPLLNNQRLIILVSKRTPVAIFSTIRYSADSLILKNLRPGIRSATERAEAMKRARNASGSRPMSAMGDLPDPLDQIARSGTQEVSYGYLLKPSKRQKFGACPFGGNGKGKGHHPQFHFTPHRKLIEFNHIHPDTADLHSKQLYFQRCISYESTFKPLKSPLLQPQISQPVHGSGREFSFTCDCPLDPTKSKNSILGKQIGGLGGIHQNQLYHPQLLDDPELRAGKHRTLLTFPSYMTSIIEYCKASDLKKELNDKFRERFPQIQLTLSKLRSLKREMRKVAKTECNIDLLTVAQAYVYFEKLILLSFVTKVNRKYCAGACLLLSAKLNDVKGENLHNLLEKIETGFRVNKKELISHEFAALVALEFALHLPTYEVSPHYQRLLYES